MVDFRHPGLNARDVAITQSLNGYLVERQNPAPRPGILLYMEAFGLNDHIRYVARRLADEGYVVLAPDFYHGDTFAYDKLSEARQRVRQLDDDTVMAQSRDALDYLDRLDSTEGPAAVVGFCMGGRLAFRAAADLADRVSAAVCFYGGGIAPEEDPLGRPPLLDRVDAIRGSLLLIYGAEDASIAPAEHGRIAAALSGAGKRYDLCVFPNAGHGFHCEQRDSYEPDAAREAWQIQRAFLGRQLKGAAVHMEE